MTLVSGTKYVQYNINISTTCRVLVVICSPEKSWCFTSPLLVGYYSRNNFMRYGTHLVPAIFLLSVNTNNFDSLVWRF